MTNDSNSNSNNDKAAKAAALSKLEDLTRAAAPDVNPRTIKPLAEAMHSLGIATLDKVSDFIKRHRVANPEVYGAQFQSGKFVNKSGTQPTPPPRPKQEFAGPYFETLFTGDLPQRNLPTVNIGPGTSAESRSIQKLAAANAKLEARKQKK